MPKVLVMVLAVLSAPVLLAADDAAAREALAEREIREELIRKLEFLSSVALDAGDLERAAWAYERLVRLDERNESYAFELVNILLSLDDHVRAQAALARLSRLVGSDARVLYLRGIAAGREGKDDERERLFREAADAAGAAEERSTVADFFERIGRPEVSRRELAALADGNDRHAAYANARLAEAEWIIGNYTQALPYYEKAAGIMQSSGLELRSREGSVIGRRIALGKALLDLEAGKEVFAVSKLRELLTAPSTGIEASILLVRHYNAAGRENLAQEMAAAKVAQLESALAREPNEASLYNTLAWFMSQVDYDIARAKMLSEASLRMEPSTPAFLDTLAEIHYRMGDRNGAIRLGRTAIALRPVHRAYYEKQLEKFRAR